MTPQPVSYYVRAVRPALPDDIFAPVRSRLAWLALHVAVAVVGIAAIAGGVGGWPGALAISLVVGHSFAGMAFCGHEMMHGAVVRGARLRMILGWLCFLPFTLSPRLWVAWHNKVHHGNTMKVGVDPDAFPTLDAFHESRLTRVADFFSFGAGRWAGFLTLLLGFTGQSTQVLLRHARHPSYLSRAEHRVAVLETILGVAVWAALGVVIGPRAFLFAFVGPLLVANAIVIGYILTNHSLSPLTEVNDPLLNSLTVTAPRIVEVLHLNFGLHVEHHLFPAMSSKHAPIVRDELLARWPERYQSMPWGRALLQLLRSARVYKDATTLIDPKTGREYPTLLPIENATRANVAA